MPVRNEAVGGDSNNQVNIVIFTKKGRAGQEEVVTGVALCTTQCFLPDHYFKRNAILLML